MADDNNERAYIGIEREEKSLKYIAKMLGEKKREISKTEYNAVVKALGIQNWTNSDEDEASLINSIIRETLKLQNE